MFEEREWDFEKVDNGTGPVGGAGGDRGKLVIGGTEETRGYRGQAYTGQAGKGQSFSKCQ